MSRKTALLGAAWITTLVLAGPGQFKPPRAAVVDTPAVFEKYEKKRVVEAKAIKERQDLDLKLKQLERQIEQLGRELDVVTEDAAEAKLVERFSLELKVKKLKEKELPQLFKRQLSYADGLRQEIEAEIQKYADANGLDFVLEKRFLLDVGGSLPFQFPVVHYAKPEFEITDEIALKLNDLYKAK
jgi:Skp family chaperone for outer membrane proteins